MNKTIMILGGSKWQLNVIMEAKRLGFHVLVTDISADAPGKYVADKFIQIDINERNELLQVAKEHNILFAFAEQTDRAVPIAAYINSNLGLSGLSVETALLFTNKYEMRHKLLDFVRMPKFKMISTVQEAKRFVEEVGTPVVIKPLSAQSSLGVYKINDQAEIGKYFSNTLEHSLDGSILIEEFIEGTELTVEGLSIDGVVYPLAVSEKVHYPFNDCVAKKLIYWANLSTEVNEEVKVYITKIVEKLGLINGIFHAELRLKNNLPYLVEIAARGGGHKLASVIAPHVSGVNLYDIILRKLSNEQVIPHSLQTPRAGALCFFDFPEGKVKSINGLEKVKADSRISEVVFNFLEGDIIYKAKDDVSRAGYYIALCENRQELDELIKFVEESVSITYD